MTSVSYGAKTDRGCRRKHNEDSYYVSAEAGLFVISDGMGGHRGGAAASALAVDRIAESVFEGATLDQAISTAHEAILRKGETNPEVRGMGATVVALRLEGTAYRIAWVGDSRAYLWDGSLTRLTRDHSLVQQMLDAGAFTPEEAKHHPGVSIVTQALGAQDISEITVDTLSGHLHAGQQLLLCSDGLTSELDDSEIARCLDGNDTAQQQADRLVMAAKERGGNDNITVILVKAPADASPPRQGKNRLAAVAIGAILLTVIVTGLWVYDRRSSDPDPAGGSHHSLEQTTDIQRSQEETGRVSD